MKTFLSDLERSFKLPEISSGKMCRTPWGVWVRYSSPILGPWARRWITTEVGDMLPPRHQTFPAAENQYQRYRIILLDDNRGTCANKLPTVVTREWNGRESNLPPLELHVQLPDHCTIRPRKVSAGPTFQNVRQHTWQTEMVHEPYGVKRISGMDAIIINVFSKTLGHRNSQKKNHTWEEQRITVYKRHVTPSPVLATTTRQRNSPKVGTDSRGTSPVSCVRVVEKEQGGQGSFAVWCPKDRRLRPDSGGSPHEQGGVGELTFWGLKVWFE